VLKERERGNDVYSQFVCADCILDIPKGKGTGGVYLMIDLLDKELE
jgi:hypothetical protein